MHFPVILIPKTWNFSPAVVGYTSLGENSTNILEGVIRRDGNNSGNSNHTNRNNIHMRIVGKPRCLFLR